MDVFAILFLILGASCGICGFVMAALAISVGGLAIMLLTCDTGYAVLYAVLVAVSLLWLL